MSFRTSKDAIVTLLTTMTGTGQPFAAVYGYLENNIPSFPCAMVAFAEGGSNSRFDSGNNLLVSKFHIYCLFRESKTLTDYDAVLDLLDDVLDKFNSAANADTLAGAVEKFTIESIDPMAVQEPEAVMGWRIVVSCTELYPLT